MLWPHRLVTKILLVLVGKSEEALPFSANGGSGNARRIAGVAYIVYEVLEGRECDPFQVADRDLEDFDAFGQGSFQSSQLEGHFPLPPRLDLPAQIRKGS